MGYGSTYMHTHTLHTHIHTYIHTYIHTNACIHIHAHIHTYIHTYIHTNACIHIHAHIHTYIHTYINIRISDTLDILRRPSPMSQQGTQDRLETVSEDNSLLTASPPHNQHNWFTRATRESSLSTLRFPDYPHMRC